MTQIIEARKGNITTEMRAAAMAEGLSFEFVQKGVAEGTITLCKNRVHNISPLAVGKGTSTKINANIGTSKDNCDIDLELAKLAAAIELGADAVMDLSTGGPIKEIRARLMEASTVAVGTVPIYQAAVEAAESRGALVSMTGDDLFRVIEEQAAQGVDFVTVHCGVTLESVARLKKEGRILDVVSRGGAFMVEWMVYHGKQNPLYADYGRLLEIAKKYDLVLSLGDGLRPGCLADATDRAQITELITLGELTEIAWADGVQVMIEGPGHVPLNQVETNIKIQKELCKGAPFYVLGPLVTDIAPGYDHITAAIGGAVAGMAGADFLCYVTPAEHLRLPTLDDVKEGVIATKIAAHAADVAKGVPGAIEKDIRMAKARKALDWEGQIALSVNPEKARAMHTPGKGDGSDACTMCGEFCAIKHVKEYFKKD
ncbi:MAG TPA: phosphomethylpyrimidine synthase ThiC [Nitrospirota bacterium]